MKSILNNFDKYVSFLQTRESNFSNFINSMKDVYFYTFDNSFNISKSVNHEKSIQETLQEEGLDEIKLESIDNPEWFEVQGGILINYNNEDSKPAAILGICLQQSNNTFTGFMVACDYTTIKNHYILYEDSIKIVNFHYDSSNEDDMKHPANRVLHVVITRCLNHIEKYNKTKHTHTVRLGTSKRRLDLNSVFSITKSEELVTC